jgi:hypothetical protein
MRAFSSKVVSTPNSSYKSAFQRLARTANEDPEIGEATNRSLCGIISDFMAYLTSADAPGAMNGALLSNALDLARAARDVNTFAYGDL